MELIVEKFYSSKNLARKKLNSLSPIQLGFGSAVFTFIVVNLFVLLFTTTNFLSLLFNVVHFFFVAFCLFSLFTWFALINDNKSTFSHQNVFFSFVTFFLSEFFNQIILFHLNDAKTLKSGFSLADNFMQTFLIGFMCTLANFFLIESSNLNSPLLLCVCLARFYATGSLTLLSPSTLSAYFAYFCALSGILFSYHLKHLLKADTKNNPNNLTTPHKEVNREIDNENSTRKKIVFALTSNNFLNDDLKQTKQKRTVANNNNNKVNDILCQRRTSLPTIPLKNDKVTLTY